MTLIECIGAAVSLLAIYLTARRKLWCFPLGMLSCLIYMWIFYQSKLYADTALQLFFIGCLIWGWRAWTQDAGALPAVDLPVARQSVSQLITWCAIGSAGTLLLAELLNRFTDSNSSLLDAGTTVFSLIAQIWVGRRYRENWPLWMVVNLVFVVLYVQKALYVTAVLYAVFILLAIYGWKQWQAKVSP
jgi:nicotinamide mononucleotide transporter